MHKAIKCMCVMLVIKFFAKLTTYADLYEIDMTVATTVIIVLKSY